MSDIRADRSRVRFEPRGRLSGALRPPSDKSISHRAALLAAMSDEPVSISNYLDSADTNATLDAMRAVGALVEERPDDYVIRGTGLHAPHPTSDPIDVRNAGTLMRLLPGWLAGQRDGSWTIDGDASIRRRPIDRVAVPLERMGARIDAREGRFAPFTVHGAALEGIDYELPVASAQVKSCVLIAGLAAARGTTRVREPVASRDHTERMLVRAGARVEREPGRVVAITHADELELDRVEIPGDLSSAAFWIAAALIVPRSSIRLDEIGVNWTRTGFLRIVERMGGVVVGDLEPVADASAPIIAAEPASDLEVRHGELAGTVVEADEVPLAIDELPLVALLGCFAEGETIVRGAGELRVKESDRITVVVDGLRGLGAEIEATPDGFVVQGTGGLRGGQIESRGDHRIAMLGAIAGLAAQDGVEVVGMDAAAVSYPRFIEDIERLVR